MDNIHKSVNLSKNKITSQIDISYTEDLKRSYMDVVCNTKTKSEPKKTNMETLVKKKIKRHIFKNEKIVAPSKAWKCCGNGKRCGEEMYRGESSCNWCKKSRCSNCKSLER